MSIERIVLNILFGWIAFSGTVIGQSSSSFVNAWKQQFVTGAYNGFKVYSDGLLDIKSSMSEHAVKFTVAGLPYKNGVNMAIEPLRGAAIGALVWFIGGYAGKAFGQKVDEEARIKSGNKDTDYKIGETIMPIIMTGIMHGDPKKQDNSDAVGNEIKKAVCSPIAGAVGRGSGYAFGRGCGTLFPGMTQKIVAMPIPVLFKSDYAKHVSIRFALSINVPTGKDKDGKDSSMNLPFVDIASFVYGFGDGCKDSLLQL